MRDLRAINDEIQRRLAAEELETVTAVDAGRWLDEAGLLKDSASRRGLPLRELLRAGQIEGQRQESNARWFIDARIESPSNRDPDELLSSSYPQFDDALISVMREAAELSGNEGRSTRQRGITYKVGGATRANVFPGSGVQVPQDDRQAVASWVGSGSNYFKLHLRNAPGPADLEQEAVRLVRARADHLCGEDRVATSSSRKHAIQLAPYSDPPQPTSRSDADPYLSNPELLERGNAAHRKLEMSIRDLAEERGLTPRKAVGGADFDIGWESSGTLTVVEVKSLTIENETRQLRLGLGQLLHYAHQLRETGTWGRVRSVLAVEQEPREPGWKQLCAAKDVKLVWPACLEGCFDDVILQEPDPERGRATTEKLKALGVRRILVSAAERGYITQLACKMPECYCPEELGGACYFEPVTKEPTDWMPTHEHFPRPKRDGGQRQVQNSILAHRLCNRVDYSKTVGRPYAKDLTRVKAAREAAIRDQPD